MAKVKVAVLGATGMIGQRFVQLLEDHPYFEMEGLYASERSEGKRLAEVLKVKDRRIPARFSRKKAGADRYKEHICHMAILRSPDFRPTSQVPWRQIWPRQEWDSTRTLPPIEWTTMYLFSYLRRTPSIWR